MRTLGFSVWVTGADHATVRPVAEELARRLEARHLPVELLDERTPDVEAITGSDAERRLAFVAARLAHHGVVTIVSLSVPSRAGRDRARTAIGRMIEVHVHAATAIGCCNYEPPERAEVEIVVPEPTAGSGSARVIRALELLGLLSEAADAGYSADEEREVIRRLKAFGYL